MEEETLLKPIVVVIFLLFTAALSAIVVKRIRFPYTIGLVLVGIAIALAAREFNALSALREVRLSPDIILYLILPTLLFEAAINIHFDIMRKNIVSILVLATVGLFISTLIVGVVVGNLTPLSMGAALLFGALISATDPVAVIALFKELGVPDRLSTLVDGESLFNDATAIVMFNILLGIVLTGGAVSAGLVVGGVANFFIVFFGGLVIGVALAVPVLWLVELSRQDQLVHLALYAVLAYVSFIVADHIFHVSGVMAVVGAGVYSAWRAAQIFDEKMRHVIKMYWEYAAFVANSLIFLLIGLTEIELLEDLTHFRDHFAYIVIAAVSVVAARAVVVYGLSPLNNRLSKAEPVDMPYQTVMFRGGLRGAVPLALVLGLPQDFEHRVLLLDLTMGVVLLSLLIQGTTINRLLNVYNLGKGS